MKKVVILYQRGSAIEERLVDVLDAALTESQYSVYVDRHLKISIDWALSVAEKIRISDAAIVIAAHASLQSEMLTYEIEVACDARLRNPAMRMIQVPIDQEAAAQGTALGGHQTCVWSSEADTTLLIAEILEHLRGPVLQTPAKFLHGSAGGAVSSDSPFYIERDADMELRNHLTTREATILVKGARQSGKTSLVAQGLKFLRDRKCRAFIIDFQRLGANLCADEKEFCQAVAANLARQARAQYGLELDWAWDEAYGPASNLDEFVLSLVGSSEDQIVWFMDEADWLFATSFADSFFALVRSWHNARALSPDLLWNRFSVVIAYATEAHLFIQDINQSPFNVGHRIETKDFSLRQTEELNKRYGEPLRGIDQVLELYQLTDGQPFLTRTSFDYLLRSNGNLRAIIAAADRDDGPFGDHLRRVLVSVTQLSTVRAVVERALSNQLIETSPEVYRLLAAGVLSRNSSGNHVIRCKLYRRYLERHLN